MTHPSRPSPYHASSTPPTATDAAPLHAGLRADAAARALAQRLARLEEVDPAREARLLVHEVLQRRTPPADLRLAPETVLTADEVAQLTGWAAARLARQPLAQLIGRRDFWSVQLAVTPDVLTPRPETEHVVEALLDAAPEPRRPLRLVDFGVGSGAILLAVLTERPAAWGLGVDRSWPALQVAASNRARLARNDPTLAARCALLAADWDSALVHAQSGAGFDLIAANPPYITSEALTRLQPEVRDHEPRLALDGGADGLDAYRRLVVGARHVAAAGATLALEVGAGQSAAVRALAAEAGWRDISAGRDLAGHERVVTARNG